MMAAILGVWFFTSFVVFKVDSYFAFAKVKAVSLVWLWGTFILFATVFAIGFVQAFLRRARALAVACQKIHSGKQPTQSFPQCSH